MLENKTTYDMRSKTRSVSKSTPRHMQVRRLQDEIDKLALLVNEAKRQSDRIQAAADALGDAMFGELDSPMLPDGNGEKRSRSAKLDN